MLSKKAQSTIEYLIVLAVIISIALIVAAIMGWFPGSATQITETQSKAYWKTFSPLFIDDWKFENDGNYYFYFTNNSLENVTLESITINGTTYSVGTNVAAGSSKTVIVNSNTCNPGENIVLNVSYKYSTSGISNKEIIGKKPVVGICASNGILYFYFTDDTESEFDLGTYTNTDYNSSANALMLNSTGLTNGSGEFESRVFDANNEATYTHIKFVHYAPYGIPLPDNKSTETSYLEDNVDMSNNLLLLHLDESSGTIIDSSGSNNNGTAYNIEYGKEGIFNKALKFNGSNSKVQINENTSLALTNNFSYGAWFKADSFRNWAGIMSRMRTWGNGYNLQVGTTQKIACGFGVYTNSDTMPDVNKWYFAVCVYDNGTMYLYVNGELQTDHDTRTMNTGVDDLQLGVFYTSSTSLDFNGVIDEVFVIDRVLTADEIKAMYKRGILRLKHQIRVCDNSDCSDGTYTGPTGTTSYYEKNNLESDLSLNGRYFQYKSYFETLNSNYSPKLKEVDINGHT